MASQSVPTAELRTEAVAPPPIITGPLAGDPAFLGMPIFAAGSIALGLALVGYIPAAAVGGVLPIIFAATGLGLFVAAVWAAALGQTAVAGVFGLFSGFWWSYAALVLGLNHDWYKVPAANLPRVQAIFLISWAVVFGVLTLSTLHLPLSFTLIFGLVVVALVALTVGTLNADDTWTKIGGWVVLAFAAVGLYVFNAVASAATGGRAYPLGRPLVK
jgi:succinate-acetate transporter protein